MNIIRAHYTIESIPDYQTALRAVEAAARTCYQSEPRGDTETFVRGIIARGHESVIEHVSMTVRFIVDRGVSHELVRHRLAAYSQESTRYCRYDGHITFIEPCFLRNDSESYQDWSTAMLVAESAYHQLMERGLTPSQARSVLPNSVKTEIVMSANFREWRHVFRLRTSPRAHEQMREVMVPLRDQVAASHPAFFA